jgi:hypothetical protein
MMNWLTDQDWGWRPFLFLRPGRDRDMRNPLLLKMALCYGSTLAVLLLLLRFSVEHTITAASTVAVVFFCWIGFFLGYKFTFAIFWNRRARRLRTLGADTNAKV